MKKILALILVILCIAAFAACGSDKDDSGKGSGSSASDTSSDGIAAADKTIKTPYADLRVTTDFYEHTDYQEMSKDPYILTFSSKEGKELFALHFNHTTDNVVGTLKQKDKNIVIYMTLGKLDSKDANYDRDCRYQEEVNVIIESLEEDYDFIPYRAVSKDDSVDTQSVDTFNIKTTVTTLKYPKRWKDKVDIDNSGDTVKFSCDDTPLFDLVFNEGKGYLLGTYKDTPIYVIYHEVKKDEHIEMVDDVNIILQNLMKDKNFKVNTNNNG